MNGTLVCISSAYARAGVMWEMFDRWYGKPDGPLVWRATSREMNPTLPARVVERALAEDEAAAGAEYLSIFRSDVERFLTREALERCIPRGLTERPPVGGTHYYAFADPSGGASDSFTLAIGHVENQTVVLDLVRETKPPFQPSAVVEAYAALCRAYRVTHVQADKYAAAWTQEAFEKSGLGYTQDALSKSELYLNLLPMLNSAQCELLDLPRLKSQLLNLERRTARSGRDSVDHSPGGRDDVANAVAGVLNLARAGIGSGIGPQATNLAANVYTPLDFTQSGGGVDYVGGPYGRELYDRDRDLL
jgi:hypothetical protein